MKLLYKLRWVALALILNLGASDVNAQAFTENFDNISTLTGSGWFTQNNSTTIGLQAGWFQGNSLDVFSAYNGASTAYIAANFQNTTGTNTISNWLVTPSRIIHNGDVITFYTRTTDITGTVYDDRLQVRMSTNGTSTNVGVGSAAVGDFTTLLLDINSAYDDSYPHTWTQYTVTVSGLPAPVQGRFAFRYYVTSGGPLGANSDYIGIDNVVYTPSCTSLAISPSTLLNATVGTPYTQNFTLTQGYGTVNYSITAGALPPGMSFTTGGVLSGTPTATGTYNFTIGTTDGSLCTASTSYSITVACPTVSLSPVSGTLPDATAGTAYTQNITLTGSTSTTITYAVSAGTLPAGVTLTTAGVLAGTATTPGTYNFTVTGTDQYGCNASRAYTLTVICPTITVSPVTFTNGVVGTAYSNAVTSTGGSGTVTYSVSGVLPQGITIGSNGIMTGTPTLPGTYNFTVIATDVNNCTGQQIYTFVIDCQAITIDQATIASGTVNAAYSETLTQTGGVGTGSYAITAGALPAGVTLSSTGVLSGTPTQPGIYNATVTFTDDNGCTGVQAYTLVIACQTMTIDQTTQPNGVAGVTYAGTSITQTGGTGTVVFDVNSGALPAGIVLNADGTFSGAPTVVGTFTFGIRATDVNNCTSNTQSFTIDITCATVAIDQTSLPDAIYNTPYSESLTQTGGVGTITYTMTGGALPAGLSMDAAGNITGTPTVGPGLYTIDVQAEDANGCQSAVQTIVLGANWPLAITLVDFSARAIADGNTMVNWETQHIDGTEQFFVEHSTDGKNFTTVASVRAVKGQVKYNATHNNAPEGVNYYRLRSVELNGELSYSKIVRLSNRVNTRPQVALLPNMVTDKATLQVTANEAGKIQLRVTDITGREVYQHIANINAGDNAIILDLHELSVASYTLQVIINNEMIPVKFIKM